MHFAVLTVLALLPAHALGVVGCRAACARCRARREPHPRVLQVYCAMCRECAERPPGGAARDQAVYDLDGYPDDCPTPPPCETDTEDVPPQPLVYTKRSTTTTSSTTTTTRRPCPPVVGCAPRPPRPRCHYPCVPACPCPQPRPPPALVSTTTGKTTGYFYVYIGVPRDVLQKTNQ